VTAPHALRLHLLPQEGADVLRRARHLLHRCHRRRSSSVAC
jgi:hypothetical protein